MKTDFLRRCTVVLYWAILIALAALFFTNDFGIVDISKTTIITAVGVDIENDEVQVTAQIALPKASQSGDSVEYADVQGSGETIADALNEINAKTGYYPKLQFCKLILIGDSCKNHSIFRMLGCFYRKNYSELTALVAMCKGKASEMLGLPMAASEIPSTVLQRSLSEELKKSANVSSVNLKDIAVDNFSPCNACYMPYIEAVVQGTSEQGGNGDSVGGDTPQSNSQNSGGSGGGSGGGGEGGGQGQQEQGGGQKPETVEFTARKTAVFNDGKFVQILDDRQSFALDILKNEIRLAVLPCDTLQYHYTLGLKSIGSGTKLKVKDGIPELTVNFKAYAQIAGIKKPVQPKETASDDKIPEELKRAAEEEIKQRINSLIEVEKSTGCDFLGIKNLLFKYNYKHYEDLKDGLLNALTVKYDIKIDSVN